MKKNVIIALSALLAAGLVGCGPDSSDVTPSTEPDTPTSSSVIPDSPESSEPPAKTALAAPTNLKAVRNDAGKWVVSFTSVEHADRYSLLVEVEDELGAEEYAKNENIASGYEVEPGDKTGTYKFSLIAKDSKEAYLDSEAATFQIAVEIYNEKEVNSIKMTGRVEDGVPVGAFHWLYSNGTTYDGTITSEFKRLKGKLQYANKMYYEGDFVEDNFGGDGMFTWSTTGNYKDGNTYIGKFSGGNYNDQIGSYYLAANWLETIPVTYNGLISWTGKMGSIFGCPGKKGELGQGKLQYQNNSIYTGSLLKTDDEWGFIRQGWGKNAWIVEEGAAWITGGSGDYKIDNFEGNFDSQNHTWIYGDGIWYFKKDGAPYGYIKGNWDGGNRLGEATSELTVQEAYANAIDLTPAVV